MSDTPDPGAGGQPAVPVTGSSKGQDAPRQSGGVTFGIILVLVGVAVLAGRFVPGLNIVNAWPLIIVVLGLARVFRSRDVYGVLDGATSVLVGAILLMNTTGRLSWSVWLTIFSLWPLLLIAAGLAIVGRAVSQSWLRVAGQAVIIGGLLYGALIAPQGTLTFPLYVTSLDSGPMRTFEDAYKPRSGEATITQGTADVSWGAANVTVREGAGLVEVSGVAPAKSQPVLDVGTADGRAAVSVGVPSGGGGAGPDGKLDVTLGRDIRWEALVLRTGATSTKVDLSRLAVDNVELDTGASDTRIVIGDEAPSVSVRINAGVANVVLRVPKNAEVSVRVRGLVATNWASGFSMVEGSALDGRWERTSQSPSTRVDAIVSGGIMNLDVETY